MIKFIKIFFVCLIAATAIISCRTFFEGEKIKFNSSPFLSHPNLANDSLLIRSFGY